VAPAANRQFVCDRRWTCPLMPLGGGVAQLEAGLKRGLRGATVSQEQRIRLWCVGAADGMGRRLLQVAGQDPGFRVNQWPGELSSRQ